MVELMGGGLEGLSSARDEGKNKDNWDPESHVPKDVGGA